jgi:MFS family permease
VSLVFLINGIAGANWFVRIPAIQDRLDLSTASLGLLLLGLPSGAVMAMPLAGGLVARLGSRTVNWWSTVGVCLTVALVGLAPNPWLLFGALFLFGATNGAMDVSMNAQGVAVERHYGRSIMAAFHGMFSIGAMAGAAMGGFIASFDVAAQPHLVSVGLILSLAALLVPRWMLPPIEDASSREPGVAADKPTILIRIPRAVLTLGLVGFCGLLAEGAMADWSAVFLRDVLDTTAGVAAAGYAVFSFTMAVGRFSGDRLSDRIGSVAIVRYGSLVAATGLLAVALTPWPALALIGFGLAGAGLSIIVPIIFSTAGRTPGLPSGQAIAAVTTISYVGFLAGPPLIGIIASVVTLRGSFLGIVALALAMSALAGTVRHAESLQGRDPAPAAQPIESDYATLRGRPIVDKGD